ncbi:MAG: hypothetical protein H7Y20_00105 [Bryobacteraceae bacterium]|nr:hypothetical protein [Bryobacteraceae bacterium]
MRSASAAALFPQARAPEAAMSGLWLYFFCFDEAHDTANSIATAEGSFWHGILHRQEPDASNAGYWFRQVGKHPIFPRLVEEAQTILSEYPAFATFRLGSEWNPFEFINLCEKAAELPGSDEETAARRIQLAEWQLLFDYCARPPR